MTKKSKVGYWDRCPSCGALGKIDEEQLQGKVSIECSECGHHYHRSVAKLTYLGKSGTHYILKLEDDEGFIGIAELKKCRAEWAKEYYYDDINQKDELEIRKSMTLMSIESLRDIIEEEPDLYSEKDIKVRSQKEEQQSENMR